MEGDAEDEDEDEVEVEEAGVIEVIVPWLHIMLCKPFLLWILQLSMFKIFDDSIS